MSSWTVITKSRNATLRLARAIGSELQSGNLLALEGELGAGKTTFVQGLAQGLGIKDLNQVLSPSYTLMNEYDGGRLLLVHMDFYRINDSHKIFTLGLDEQLNRSDAVVVVEWADRMKELFPVSTLWVHFQWKEKHHRLISFRGPSPLIIRKP